jgi:hypothetical protein
VKVYSTNHEVKALDGIRARDLRFTKPSQYEIKNNNDNDDTTTDSTSSYPLINLRSWVRVALRATPPPSFIDWLRSQGKIHTQLSKRPKIMLFDTDTYWTLETLAR